MTQPLVSVVTPFHNTAVHLGTCIDSVISQTWTNFEYILVNNRSTDGADAVARDWARRDSRIRVIDQPAFLSQVDNYNAALTHIAGDSAYVKLVQADDHISSECLEQMVGVGELDPAVAIIASWYSYGPWVLFRTLPEDVPVHDGRAVCRQQLLSPWFFMGNPTTVMYRAACVRSRSPFYDPARFHEDTEVCFELLRTHKLGFVPRVLSWVRTEDDPESVTGARKDDDWFLALQYTMLRRFGPEFLTPEELAPVERRVTRLYARRLLRAALSFRRGGYFAFHRRRVAELGESLTPFWVMARALA
ncbi:MAG TPA: glycosyltransferase family A protein [Gemmatimonadaceae bacterium]|nr:glycosyltransferase family A protein [Gemmatimonadaceae bacterium]